MLLHLVVPLPVSHDVRLDVVPVRARSSLYKCPQHLWYLDLDIPHVADGRLEGGWEVGRQQEAEGEVVNTLAQSQSRSGFVQSIY